MASNNDSIQKTITVALTLCIVCSVIVSAAAVMLKPAQEANKALDFKRNILSAAGLLEEGKSVDELFEQVAVKIIDLDTGKYTDAVNSEDYEQRAAAKDPKYSESLPSSEDIAGISRREKYAKIYEVRKNGEIEALVLPVHGYGLWGILYGFLAVEGDLETVVGLGFYEHKETPGLGAEVDNPKWKALWSGKSLFSDNGDIAIEVIKGKVVEGTSNAQHKIDGLSGATLTSRGVHNMLQYWLSQNGYGKFLNNLGNGEA